MTGQEALDPANGILESVQQEPLRVEHFGEAERENVSAVLRAYVARLRMAQPRFPWEREAPHSLFLKACGCEAPRSQEFCRP